MEIGRRHDLTDRQTTPLRLMLEDIDARLLNLLTGAHPLEDTVLQQIATLESARAAVQRLLTDADQRAAS
jgi:succinate dehydrogenase flavin-adding protein (antitoxin of CptAB toxin-antitoxin module)